MKWGNCKNWAEAIGKEEKVRSVLSNIKHVLLDVDM